MHNLKDLRKNLDTFKKKFKDRNVHFNIDEFIKIVGETREFVRSWSNQTEITVPGIHFLQEDAPDEIGAAIARWLPI